MIPYFELQNIALGPITLQVWGIMVALGILAGTFAAHKYAKAKGLVVTVIDESITWILIGAFIGARLFHVLFYNPTYFLKNPLEILAIWQGGLSIAGGLTGAILVGIWFLKRKKVSVIQYAGALVFGLPLGSFIGRIGCFLLHLHPGKPTNFFLGVMYPNGIARHDLGLYLSLNNLALFLVFLIILFKKKVSGKYFVVTYLLWYGISRFLLDFLRAYEGSIVDARYLGLTPAQYFSIIMVTTGFLALNRIKHKKKKSFRK